MMLNPLPGAYFSPTANATMDDMFLVKKYRPPGSAPTVALGEAREAGFG